MLDVIAQSSGNSYAALAPLLLMGGLFYLLLIRPQQKRQRAQRQMIAEVEVGDEIVTTGGIFAIVTEIDEDEGTITAQVAAGVEIRLVRAAIARRLVEEYDDVDDEPQDGADPGPVSDETAGPPPDESAGVTLEQVQANDELSLYISSADRVMGAMGYTEHGFRHANLVAKISLQVLTRLGFTEREATLGAVAGYLHDVGNALARDAHGQTGALLVYHALRDEVPGPDLMPILAAIANHEETEGVAVSPVSAAVILADKSDVHRSRVRTTGRVADDIHDRVNHAVEQSFLRVDSDARTVSLELTIDPRISQIMEYFEIFLGRMQMCRHAAECLDARFRLEINGAEVA